MLEGWTIGEEEMDIQSEQHRLGFYPSKVRMPFGYREGRRRHDCRLLQKYVPSWGEI